MWSSTIALIAAASVAVTTSPSGANVQVALFGRSSADDRQDILKVVATPPDGTTSLAGSVVTLKALIDGVWTQVGPDDSVLNSRGKVRIAVRDHNGDRVTKYRAKIAEPTQTVSTNRLRLR